MQLQRASDGIDRAVVVPLGHQELALGVPGLSVLGIGGQDLVNFRQTLVVSARLQCRHWPDPMGRGIVFQRQRLPVELDCLGPCGLQRANLGHPPQRKGHHG